MSEDKKKIRVRFAPSPTGPLHIGGVRTAYYNYLFAKKHGGDFLLRIEDTDEKRFVEGAEDYIIESLKWLGICPDIEPVDGVFRQSEHLSRYEPHARKLLEAGLAYMAFDTEEELAAKREEYKKAKTVFKYDYRSRESMRNSLTLSQDAVDELLASGAPYTIRAKVPRGEEIRFHDTIRGWVNVNTDEMDDKVILKTTGIPTYHLASIVDDMYMGITHVIRGEEWLPSAPFHVFLYNSLEKAYNDKSWRVPEFVHLPLILGPNGKLKKRDGDKHGFPVFPIEWTDPETGDKSSGYRESGYLPGAVLNIISLLGWNPKNGMEYMTPDEILEHFDLDKINKAGAKFDLNKANWLNREHMRNADNMVLADLFMPTVKANTDMMFTYDYVAKVCGLLKERTHFVSKFWEDGWFMFVHPDTPEFYNSLELDKKEEFIQAMHDRVYRAYKKGGKMSSEEAKAHFNKAIEDSGIQPRDAGKALRGAMCGVKVGPSLFDIMHLYGHGEICRRLMLAMDRVPLG